jgi:thymidylate synthase (FAD)
MNKTYKILDDLGFVRLVGFMGGDLTAVEAARVSFGKGKTNQKRDRQLVNFLMSEGHHSPFEHTVFRFHVKCPIFVMRQWIRHRIASYNEKSGRYAKMKEEFHVPKKFRRQVKKNYVFAWLGKKASIMAEEIVRTSYNLSYRAYQKLLELGVAKEQARLVLPLSLYTEFYWTINGRSLMNFIKLRNDKHAQWEIRQFAKVIDKIFKEKCPWTHSAFIRFYIHGEKLEEEE